MKKNFLLACLSLIVFAFAVSAQDKAADYSGTWSLDVSKSKLDDRMRVESMTMTVAQTEKDITITTETKRPAPPADAPQGGGRPGGGMGRMGGGDGTNVYTLDGKESKAETDGPRGKMPVTLIAKTYGKKLSLRTTSDFSGPAGNVTVIKIDNWELSEDGKTLTVSREQTTPRGTINSTLIFNKK